MRRTTLTALVLLACAAEAQGPDDDAKTIRSEYWCTGLVQDGEKGKLSVVSQIRLTPDGKTCREYAGEDTWRKLDYRLPPRTSSVFRSRETTYLQGLYEIKRPAPTLLPRPAGGGQTVCGRRRSSRRRGRT